MTPAAASAPRSSPLLSVWSHPRDTIDRVLAKNPSQHVLLLAVLSMTSDFMVRLVSYFGFTGALLDWRIISAVVLGGIIAGLLGLYIGACFLKWSAKPLGGRASMGAIRAVIAWGSAPLAIGVPICLVVLIGLMLSGIASASTLIIIIRAIAAALGLWSILLAFYMYRRVQNFGFWRAVVSFVLAWILFLSVALVIRTFFFQPFNTPSGSMMPTLVVGDYMFVSKYSYGYTHYSLPFSPRLFSGRVLASEPQRGDVVVFRLPMNDSIDYVKRIVGLPGDRIRMIDGELQINEQPVKHERIDDFVGDGGERIKSFRETLPNGVSYTVLTVTDNGFYDNTPLYTVLSGHYFMLGDNLDNSTDSRVLSQVGYVPFENLIGRVRVIYFSINRTSEKAPPAIRYERIGTVVR